MKKIRNNPGIIALLVAVVLLTFALVSVMIGNSTKIASATGIPTNNTLFYAGKLEDAATGKPAKGPHNIEVYLFSMETGGTQQCYTNLGQLVIVDGRFRVALDKSCVTAIQKNPSLWIEVVVDKTALPRSKIGAVPYAVEPKEAAKWDTAYGWGNHASVGYMKSYKETDPEFKKHVASGVTTAKVTNWDKAYKWGNHGTVGYLTNTGPAAAITTTQLTNWGKAYGWGNHAIAGYMKNYKETDPTIKLKTKDYVSKWDGAALVSGTIYDNGNVIGIGTTSPAAKLHVQLSGSDSAGSGVYIENMKSKGYGIFATGSSTAQFVQTKSGGYGLYVNRIVNEAGSFPLVHFWDKHILNKQPTLKVRQDGTGNIVSLFDGTTEVFTVTDGGKVGIGTANPTASLDVRGNGARIEAKKGLAGTPSTGLNVYNENTNPNDIIALFSDGYAYNMVVKRTGNVGIGTKSPSSRLDVSGGCITGTMCSDKRLKKNVCPVGSDNSILDKVAKLRAVKYQWKNGKDEKTYLGFIAQDVEKVFPEVVSTPSDGSAGKGISCNGLNAVTLEAIKELKRMVESQQVQIGKMRLEIGRLRRVVAHIEGG